MTKISLRVYNREIEAMVESGQVEEAIAHCQYILKTFPMHLETYRLLGKAFLETRKYSDAADIFQRVLMSVPEDFVSHVGMSIIRDDENKLDEAIWHMERAFEVQPSNPAIQDELRKLYGRRDGVQPPKVRLTRDALANMYTQGALYSQAIAEIRSVLADDPNRPDLQVMLARAYSKDGRKKQAIEICTELLKNFPYCFDALRILIDLMPPSDQHEFIQNYTLRVKALDPYAGFVTGSIFNSDNVPDAAVNLELLDYDPNDKDSGSQPAWASSLGIRLEPENAQQDVPDWLSKKTDEIQPVSEEDIIPAATDVETETSSEVEDVPDWMRSSGWEKPSDQTLDNAVFNDTDLGIDEPLAKADIPDWLQDMAPDEELREPDKLPDGFESMLDGNSINDSLSVTKQEPSLIEEVMENDISEEDIPTWMNDDVNDEPILEETPSTVGLQSVESDQDVFNPLSSEEPQDESEKTSGQPVDDISSWLGDVQKEAIDGGSELKGIRNIEEDLPDWLKDIGSETQNDNLDITNKPITELPKQPEGISSTGDQYDPNLVANTEDELPDWLKEIDSTQEEITKDDDPNAKLGTGSEISSQEDVVKDIPKIEINPEAEIFGNGVEIQALISEDATLKIEPVNEELPSMDDQDAAMAWLESLAAKQGAKSEELLTNPEDRSEEPPEWVKNSIKGETISIDDEKTISMPSEPELFDIGIADENESEFEAETEATELTGVDEQFQVVGSNGQEEPAEEKAIASISLDNSPEESIQDEPKDSPEIYPSVPYVQPSNVMGDLSIVDDQEAGYISDRDHDDSSDSDIDKPPESDDSEWLKELDADDATLPEEPIAPKVTEFYGSKTSDPLPDWLKEMENEATSSEWISESEGSPEIIKGSNVSELMSDEKDIDDIGEIFPTDASNWTVEDSDSDPGLESLGEVVKPVTSGEWQPVQPEEETTTEDIIEISKFGSTHPNKESDQVSNPTGMGMLSRIPAKDIEKEAGTLERAQSFIESGEIKKAIDEYGRLIKKNQLLEGVIHDLRETTYRYPIEVGIWQLLGDAYMRANRLQDALDAYTKAEELFR